MTTETGTYTYTDDDGYADSLDHNTVQGTYHYFDEDERYFVFIPSDSKFYIVVHEGNGYHYTQESAQEVLDEMTVAYL